MEPPSNYRVSVINPNDFPIDSKRIESAVCAALSAHDQPDSDVRVLLTTDQDIKALNGRYRDQDEPTDVLTFPEEEGLASGDIAIATEFASRQAAAHGIAPADEIVLLAIHGSLHLAGLDDHSDRERAHMIAEMNVIASRMGLPVVEDWSSVHP